MAKIEGREKLRRKFLAMPSAVRAEVTKAVLASAQELTGMQKRLAPKNTGALADSIRYEIQDGGFRAAIIAGGVPATQREVRKGSGKFTDVAVLMEFGTKAHEAGGEFAGATIPAEPPRPFFHVAFRALRKRIKGRLTRSISAGIKKAAQG